MGVPSLFKTDKKKTKSKSIIEKPQSMRILSTNKSDFKFPTTFAAESGHSREDSIAEEIEIESNRTPESRGKRKSKARVKKHSDETGADLVKPEKKKKKKKSDSATSDGEVEIIEEVEDTEPKK